MSPQINRQLLDSGGKKKTKVTQERTKSPTLRPQACGLSLKRKNKRERSKHSPVEYTECQGSVLLTPMGLRIPGPLIGLSLWVMKPEGGGGVSLGVRGLRWNLPLERSEGDRGEAVWRFLPFFWMDKWLGLRDVSVSLSFPNTEL